MGPVVEDHWLFSGAFQVLLRVFVEKEFEGGFTIF